MHSALLADGKVVTAKAYDDTFHGEQINCMDKSCLVPVFFIPGSNNIVPHFKTSGKGESIHKENCGFAKKLTFQESVSKVSEYQKSIQEQGIREFVVRLNLNKIDPDYVPNSIERKQKDPEDSNNKNELDSDALKDDTPTPQSIGSLRSVKKLFTTIEPDLLASIIISVKGKRIPISELIQHYENAQGSLWAGVTMDVPYFIHGRIENVIRLKKVMYINFYSTDNGFFSLVLFKQHFNHFTLKDEELIDKDVLAYGYLKKNEFQKNNQSTEMIIKSDDYIEFL